MAPMARTIGRMMVLIPIRIPTRTLNARANRVGRRVLVEVMVTTTTLRVAVGQSLRLPKSEVVVAGVIVLMNKKMAVGSPFR